MLICYLRREPQHRVIAHVQALAMEGNEAEILELARQFNEAEAAGELVEEHAEGADDEAIMREHTPQPRYAFIPPHRPHRDTVNTYTRLATWLSAPNRKLYIRRIDDVNEGNNCFFYSMKYAVQAANVCDVFNNETVMTLQAFRDMPCSKMHEHVVEVARYTWENGGYVDKDVMQVRRGAW